VTSSSVECHTVELTDFVHDSPRSDPYGFTPFGAHVDTHYPKFGEVCRWAGDHIEQATDQERSSVPPEFFAARTPSDTDDFDNNVDGWSPRALVAGSPDRRFTVDVDDQFRLSMTNVATDGSNGTASIEILFPCGPQINMSVTTRPPLPGDNDGANRREPMSMRFDTQAPYGCFPVIVNAAPRSAAPMAKINSATPNRS
jgi:hypothetical protein